MTDSVMRLEYRDHIAIVTFDRPDRKNSFNEQMWTALEQIVSDLKDKTPRAIIITGAGHSTFCSGFDVNPDNPQVSGLIDAVQTHDRSPVESLIKRIRSAVDSLVNLPVPIIAAINGNAFGGGAELAVRCDLRVVDPDAVICFSEVRLGLMPDWGGGACLSRLVGPSKATDIILSARRIKAREALRLGLVNYVSTPDSALQESIELAKTIVRNGPRAVRYALEIIRSSPSLPLDQALDLETELAVDLIASGECYYGISAFLEKKEPEFPEPEW